MSTRPDEGERRAFALGSCRACRKEVLAHFEWEPDEAWLCVHCDRPLGGGLRWVDAEELEESGYALDAGGGCGNESCGGGSCGTAPEHAKKTED